MTRPAPRLDATGDGPKAELFSALYDVRAGMLGLVGTGAGYQPMTHFPDAETGIIWFVSAADTDLVGAVDLGEDAEYIVIGSDHRLHASMRGKLYHVQNRAKLEELWSAELAAWFEGGRDDPRIALLRFEAETAEVWTTDKGAVGIGVEFLRANLTGKPPEIGSHATVTFVIGM